ncbi:hypothetical protein MMC20_001657 [Loxospora ochrophaea]|nr:hypothetical protein [Loxospora ochrophaea]
MVAKIMAASTTPTPIPALAPLERPDGGGTGVVLAVDFALVGLLEDVAVEDVEVAFAEADDDDVADVLCVVEVDDDEGVDVEAEDKEEEKPIVAKASSPPCRVTTFDVSVQLQLSPQQIVLTTSHAVTNVLVLLPIPARNRKSVSDHTLLDT